jgi:hypothetical protein
MGRPAKARRLGTTTEGQPSPHPWTAEDITATRLRTRRAQGLPDTITDPVVLDAIVQLMLPTYKARVAEAAKPRRRRRRRTSDAAAAPPPNGAADLGTALSAHPTRGDRRRDYTT